MPRVVVYLRPGCEHCQAALAYLDERGVPYHTRDVTSDAEAMADLKRMNAPGLPVIVVDRDAVLGFDKIRLDDVLKAKGVWIGPPPAQTPR